MTVLRRLWNLLITLLLAPGIVSHESAHAGACQLFGVHIRGETYLNPFTDDAYIVHERVESFPADIGIAIAPFVVNSGLGVGAFVVAALCQGTVVVAPLLWVGGSLALTAFPSGSDATTVVRTASQLPIWHRPVGYLIAVPLRVFTLIPGAPGVAGTLWVVVCYRVGTASVPPI